MKMGVLDFIQHIIAICMNVSQLIKAHNSIIFLNMCNYKTV